MPCEIDRFEVVSKRRECVIVAIFAVRGAREVIP
jgi:hypothetical protein